MRLAIVLIPILLVIYGHLYISNSFITYWHQSGTFYIPAACAEHLLELFCIHFTLLSAGKVYEYLRSLVMIKNWLNDLMLIFGDVSIVRLLIQLRWRRQHPHFAYRQI